MPPGFVFHDPTRMIEELGTRTMEGLVVHGSRWAIPLDAEATGKPIEVVAETWYCKELRLVILSKSWGPKFGEAVTRVTNIERSEADASLFQVPAGYTITAR
jgi:hypothetical protein